MTNPAVPPLIFVARTQSGSGYLFSGRAGDVDVATPWPHDREAALRYAALIRMAANDIEVRTSNIP